MGNRQKHKHSPSRFNPTVDGVIIGMLICLGLLWAGWMMRDEGEGRIDVTLEGKVVCHDPSPVAGKTFCDKHGENCAPIFICSMDPVEGEGSNVP